MHSQNFFLCMGRERSLIPRIYSAIEIPKFASEIKMQMLIYNAHPRQKKGSNKKRETCRRHYILSYAITKKGIVSNERKHTHSGTPWRS